MKQQNYSVNIHWDRRYPKAGTNFCPVQLALNIHGKQFKMGLGLYATKIDFDRAMGGKGGTNEIKELRTHIAGYIAKAESILQRMANPNRETFQRLFKSETDLFTSNKTDVIFLFKEKIDKLYKEERIKTAQNCEHALKSLQKV
jgi:integrase/recombinase XerD